MNVLSIDLHVHAGNERWGLPHAAFLDALRARSVALAGLLDHAEFYLPSVQDEWTRKLFEQLKTQQLPHYERSLAGLRAFYADLDRLPATPGMRILKGLEFNNCLATPDAFLRLPDYVCFCFGDVTDEPGETFGRRAAGRIAQVGRKVRPSGKPGIVNHPFRNRFWAYRDLCDAGAAPPAQEFISADDVGRMADAAAAWDLRMEVNLSDLTSYEQPDRRAVLDLAIHAYTLLARTGAALSIGSDSHKPPQPAFSPAVTETLERAGIGPGAVADLGEKLAG